MSATHPRPATGPIRVFRADTPQEVASASIVAGALPPGRDILAIYGGGSYSPPEATVASIRAMACAHHWAAIIDLTDLPVKEVSGPRDSLRKRLGQTRATVATVRGMRDRLAGVLGCTPAEVLARIDEVYVSVLTAGTMVTAYALSPSAKLCCYPHTFISVTGRERYQLDFPRPPWGMVSDWGKRLVWGSEAVPRRKIRIDLAVTFWRDADWASHTVSFAHLVTREEMERLFAALPQEIRDYFERLAAVCGTGTGLLVLPPGDAAPFHGKQATTELNAYVRLVGQLIQREQVTSLVVKPHPRMRPDRVREVVGHLLATFADLSVVVPEDYSSLPVEVVVAPFELVACAAIISTALCTLPSLYPVRSYCDQLAAEALYGETLTHELLADWSERVPRQLIAL